MISVVILGAGNVAYHLSKAIQNTKDFEVVQIFNRTLANIDPTLSTIPATDNPNDIVTADLYIIAVSDDFIDHISSLLLHKKGLIVHTSGSTSMKILKTHESYGVFYPLQTFSKSRTVDFSEIPICIEANSNEDLSLLNVLGKSLSNDVQEVSSEQRKGLHLAAVFVCNFVNHLYTIGAEICQENTLSFDVLKPLIVETANKVLTLPPSEAQTGPAKRNDKKTMKNHLKSLTQKEHQKIYKLLSKAIKKTYEL